jgi:hypothetical protein
MRSRPAAHTALLARRAGEAAALAEAGDVEAALALVDRLQLDLQTAEYLKQLAATDWSDEASTPARARRRMRRM